MHWWTESPDRWPWHASLSHTSVLSRYPNPQLLYTALNQLEPPGYLLHRQTGNIDLYHNHFLATEPVRSFLRRCRTVDFEHVRSL